MLRTGIFSFLFVLSLYLVSISCAQKFEECDVTDNIACDSQGDEDLCLDLGCCWDVGSCIHSNADPVGPDGAVCSVPSAEKVECGVLGTTRDECVTLGCCWYTREFDGAPWCYEPSESAPEITDDPDVDPTGVAPTQTTTKDTGGGGDDCNVTDSISCDSEGDEDLCSDLGCCWITGACVHSNADPVGPDGAVCSVASAEKVECGVLGTTRDECVAAGCCWYTREFDGAPWCYVPSEYEPEVTEDPDVDPTGVVPTQTTTKDVDSTGVVPTQTTTKDSGGGGDDCDVTDSISCDSEGDEDLCYDLGCCWITGACVHSNADPVGPDGAVCSVPSAEKVECGVLGTTRDECVALGCCWYTREFDGAPWCYVPSEYEPEATEDPETDAPSPELTTGVIDPCDGVHESNDVCPGSNQDLCAGLGCCWDDNEGCAFSNGGPVGPDGTTCQRATEETVSCGFEGVTMDTCLDNGCCWKSTSDEGLPWCYYPGETVTVAHGAKRLAKEYGSQVTLEQKITQDPVITRGPKITHESETYPEPEITHEPQTTHDPGVEPDYCEGTDGIVCYGSSPDECEGLGCCWDAGCTHSNADPVGPDGADCSVESAEKVECGVLGTTRDECVALGCCWYTREFDGAPWCYYPAGYTTSGPEQTTAIPDYCEGNGDEPCQGGDPVVCQGLGCCWDSGCTHSNAPPIGPPNVECVVESGLKAECGVLGTTRDECVALGCCWYTREFDGAPWCYYGVKYEGDGDECPATERLDCLQYTEDECLDSGCCWHQTNDPFTPECFYSTTGGPIGPDDVICVKHDAQKRRCGDSDIRERACVDLHCCWHEIDVTDGPSCYFGTLYDGPEWACLVEANNKTACGTQNDPTVCVESGCCWSPTDDVTQPDCYVSLEADSPPFPDTTGTPLVCVKEDNEKRDCGESAETDCAQSGCCWQPLDPADGPSCYYGLEYVGPISECAVSPESKQPCGDQNNRDNCLHAGCCWSPTSDITQPDCYQPDNV